MTTPLTCGRITAATEAALPVQSLDLDDVVLRQLLCKSSEIAAHDDATHAAELTVSPGHRLGKRTVDIQCNDPHVTPSVLHSLKREPASNTTPTDPRSQRIRASRKGRPCNELGLSAPGLSAACPHFRARGTPCPGMGSP
jgi:hypothetical protein